jgi:hypothetical protein
VLVLVSIVEALKFAPMGLAPLTGEGVDDHRHSLVSIRAGVARRSSAIAV